MLNIAVVDDLQQDREALLSAVRAFFSGRGGAFSCRAFSDGAQLLRALDGEAFQLVFLDICMEGMDGIALARRLREWDPAVLIVFVSTSREYAFDAFPVHPFDYLIKPWKEGKLRGVLEEALRALAVQEPEVEIRVPHASMTAPVGRIASVVARGHAVEVTLLDGRRLRGIDTFGELSGRLEGDDRFLLVNRGVLVNMDAVLTIQDDVMRMKTGDVHPLRTRGRGALMARFAQYQLTRMRGGERP